MKKLVWLMAAVMLLFTACGNNGVNDNMTNDKVVQDGNGAVDENNRNNTTAGDVVDDAANGAGDIVNGAAGAVNDAVGGVENAVDEITGNGNNKNNTTNNTTNNK